MVPLVSLSNLLAILGLLPAIIWSPWLPLAVIWFLSESIRISLEPLWPPGGAWVLGLSFGYHLWANLILEQIPSATVNH